MRCQFLLMLPQSTLLMSAECGMPLLVILQGCKYVNGTKLSIGGKAVGVSSTASTFWYMHQLLGLYIVALSPSYIRFGTFPGHELCGISDLRHWHGVDLCIWGCPRLPLISLLVFPISEHEGWCPRCFGHHHDRCPMSGKNLSSMKEDDSRDNWRW